MAKFSFFKLGLIFQLFFSLLSFGQIAITTSSGTTNGAGPFTLGYVFTLSSDADITDLGQIDVAGNGFIPTAKVVLYNWDTGAKIFETTLSGATREETGFYDTDFVPITPIALIAGTAYLVAVETASPDFAFSSNGNVASFDSLVSHVEGRATGVGFPAVPATATSSTFPIGFNSDGYYGPNFKLSTGPDLTPPTLSASDIVDDVGGASIVTNQSVNYTLSFSEGLNTSTVNAGDFVNAGTANVTIGAISEIASGVYTIGVTPTTAGTLQFGLSNSATLEDLAGNSLVAVPQISDDTTITVTVGAPDNQAPNPSPMSFLTAPYASSATMISMEATTASDPAGVEYYFTETSGNPGGSDSGWQSSPLYTDTGLTTGVTYSYSVTARDLSDQQNTTVASPSLSATAQAPALPPAEITVSAPTARHLVQRSATGVGEVVITGSYTNQPETIQARVVVLPGGANSGVTTSWQTISSSPSGGNFSGVLSDIPEGGWYQLEVRGLVQGVPGNSAIVSKVGVGDIFVTLGQSNSANHGSGGYSAVDDRVSVRTAVTGANWILASDPLPIASGGGGGPWSRLGDLLAAQENIPIGFIAIGVGSTRVDQWLPGTSNYNNRLRPAIQSFPTNGFRAALWHQGESDAIANTAASTYSARISSIIAQSRTDVGWSIPWYLAEASFHPNPTLSREEPVAAGQRLAVYGDPLVYLGPTTDGFHLEDANGGKLNDSVHFNAAGLTDHAQQWRDILLGQSSSALRNGDFEDNHTPGVTGLAPLPDSGTYLTTITTNADSPSVLGWRILSASGTSAADGTNGVHNPGTGSFAGAVDSQNGGVLPNMEGRHVAMLDGGSSGNHFLYTTRTIVAPNTAYTFTVALGVRDQVSNFGGARLEIAANGQTVAQTSVDKSALDSLNGSDSSGTFNDVSVTWTSGNSVTANQVLAVKVVKEGGSATVIDFDNARLQVEPLNIYSEWISSAGFGLSPAEQSFTLDPDGDGLSNGIEALMGTHPNQFNQGLSVLFSGNASSISHPQNSLAVVDISHSYQWSTDLENWYAGDGVDSPGGGVTVTLTPSVNNGTASVDIAPSAPLDRFFVRLGVTQF